MRCALGLWLALVLSIAACGGARRRTTTVDPPPRSGPVVSPGARTQAPSAQWTAEDIATFERLATGRAGTRIDIDRLTAEQLEAVAAAIDALHARAEPDGHEERRTLLLWAIGTPQVHVSISGHSSEMVPSETDQGYILELTLALAAGVIRSPDGYEQQLHGLEGVVAYYEAARAAGAADQPLLNALLADREAGRLSERAAELAFGLAPGSVEASP